MRRRSQQRQRRPVVSHAETKNKDEEGGRKKWKIHSHSGCCSVFFFFIDFPGISPIFVGKRARVARSNTHSSTFLFFHEEQKAKNLLRPGGGLGPLALLPRRLPTAKQAKVTKC